MTLVSDPLKPDRSDHDGQEPMSPSDIGKRIREFELRWLLSYLRRPLKFLRNGEVSDDGFPSTNPATVTIRRAKLFVVNKLKRLRGDE